MAKKLKLGNDLQEAIRDLFTNTNEFKSLCSISYDTVWENPNPTAQFAAQTISNIDVSSYDVCILTYRMYVGSASYTEMGSKVLRVGETNPILDRFYFNSIYYAGYRRVTLNANSIVFSQALNEVQNSNNKWYVPQKLYGIRIGTRVNITPQDIIIDNKTLEQAVTDSLPSVIGYTVSTDSNGWTVVDNPLSPYIEYFKRGTRQITLNAGPAWSTFVLSNLPTGITNAKVAHLSGNIESWDGALNTGVNLKSNQVYGLVQWIYGGNGWNATHNWTAHVVVLRTSL